MKKILISLVTLFAVTASVVAGTQAIFADSDSVLGNTVSTATISIDAREVINKPIDVDGLLPGHSGDPGTVDLYNDGESEQYQYMYLENVTGDLCDELLLKLGYSFVDPNVFDHVFGTYSLADLTGPANRLEVGRWSPVPDNSTTRLVQQASLPEDVNDPDLMGATCTWDEVFVGEQPLPED